MRTKTPTGKASKGSVQVITSNGRLQLRFRYAGERRYLSLGLPEDRDNRLAAEMKARQIELDILSGNFDESLNKYRISVASKVTTEPSQSQAILLLSELWEQYTEYRKPQIAETTLRIQYAAVASHIDKLPSALQTISKENAGKIRDFYLKKLTAGTTKRTITQISACCNWAVDSNSIAENPFRDIASKITVPKSKRSKHDDDHYDDIDPFTIDECNAIIEGFEKHPVYNYYAPFVKFLFWTGCRTGEAIGLKWKHVSSDFSTITFCQSVSSRLKIRKCTKNEIVRHFPCNPRLQALLRSIKPEGVNPESPVFPAKRGGTINYGSFTENAWKGGRQRKGQTPKDGIVTKLVKEGKVQRYRKQYNTRHTFITLCLESQTVTVKQIADWVEDTPETILKHYVGKTNPGKVPEF